MGWLLPLTLFLAAPSPTNGITREILARAPVPNLPGYETRLMRVTYAPGVASPPHRHAVAGVGLVLRGTVESAFGDAKPVLFKAGDTFVDPANTPHTISRNPDAKEPLVLLLSYTIPVDAPNAEPLAK
ncbi:MAG: cupin domain-containing protein [Deltaproteobacteria bacterium]|nr:cupin domain-containing protein [Deltaproteobacteria bacterium]